MKTRSTPTLDYKTYLQITKDRPPSKLLLEALTFTNVGRALDMGSGGFKDSRHLLAKGFQVTALDKENPPSNLLPKDSNFTFVHTTFDKYKFPVNKFELVNAQFSLSFNQPQVFNKVWDGLTGALKQDSVFTGQLFGENDEWASNPDMTFFNKQKVDELLEQYNVKKMEEIKKLGTLADGSPKQWHYFDIIAKKK
jgi:tellurite methyltransferase